jgi:hypothetical protein
VNGDVDQKCCRMDGRFASMTFYREKKRFMQHLSKLYTEKLRRIDEEVLEADG